MKKLPSTNKEVIGTLFVMGWKSLEQWAMCHGHKTTNVSKAMTCWLGRSDKKKPHGRVTIKIMQDLHETFAKQITLGKWLHQDDAHCEAFLHLIDTRFEGVEFIRNVDTDYLDKNFRENGRVVGSHPDMCFLVGA